MLAIIALLLLGFFVVYVVDHPILQAYLLLVMFFATLLWYLFTPSEDRITAEHRITAEELRLQMCLPEGETLAKPAQLLCQ